jgi:hypothetical protein
MIKPLIRKPVVVAIAETKSVCLRLPCQGGTCRKPASRRTLMVLHCYPISSFVQRSGDGDAESLMHFDAIHASCSLSSVFVMSL